ncbi:MAG TPA: hypothetical protein VN745_08210 [Verrucomicrobiae bacterium]|nr:hypothetical protein [Verrucomicrobiae bacterium]
MNRKSKIRAVAFTLAFFAAAAIYCAQQSPINVPPAGTDSRSPANGTIVIPAGTQISAKLSSPINGKSRKGQIARAMVAFPVTVGTHLVIPAGAYVSGTIKNVETHGRGAPKVQIHFTSLVYANGYTVPLDASDAQADLEQTVAYAKSPGGSENGVQQASAFGGNAATTGPAPLPSMGPPKGFIIAFVVSAVGGVALTMAALLHRKHEALNSSLVFDTGWEFDIVLQKPLTLDAASVNAAIAASN